jgi:predicted KAP-like P-loop ATPase
LWPKRWSQGSERLVAPIGEAAGSGVVESNVESEFLYSDDPMDLSEGNDPIDRARFATYVGNVLDQIALGGKSSVVALVGPWGSGKSTLLDKVKKDLGGERWYVATHNPWWYTSVEQAIDGFFAEVRSKLPDVDGDSKEALAGFAKRVSPYGALAGLVGVDGKQLLEAAARSLEGDRSVESLRLKAEAQLSKITKPVLVVLDDLDRLEPRELLITFKLVRLLGRLPNVHYLLSYDEETLTDVLGRTDLVGDRPGRARSFLEKMVQVRIDIPVLSEEHSVVLMNQGMDRFLAANSLKLNADETNRLQELWSECLSTYLRHPRAFKRLMAQVHVTWPAVAGEVDVIDFICVTFLQTFERPIYDLVVANETTLVGSASFSSSPDELKAEWLLWLDKIKKAGAKHPEKVASLLSLMFLPLLGAKGGYSLSEDYAQDVARRLGIGSPEYFERYIQHGVPRSDVSETLISAFLSSISVPGDEVEALAELETKFDSKSREIMAKLERRLDDGLSPLALRGLLRWVGEHYVAAMDLKSGFFGASPDFHLLRIGLKVAAELPAEVVAEDFAAGTASDSGLSLWADMANRAVKSPEGSVWLSLVKEELSNRIMAYIERAFIEPPTGPKARLAIRMAWRLRELKSKPEVQDLLWNSMQLTNAWSLEDLLTLLLPVGESSDGHQTWPSFGDLKAGDVDELLNLDRVLKALSNLEEIDEIPDSDELPHLDVLPWELRKERAMLSMRLIKRQHGSSSQ